MFVVQATTNNQPLRSSHRLDVYPGSAYPTRPIDVIRRYSQYASVSLRKW